MGISDELRALNVEIGKRETAGDKEWFGALLAPEFTMRRASGSIVDRDGFLESVGSSARRETRGVTGAELERAAYVMCVVSMEQPGGGSKSFRNYRAFVRADTTANWKLVGWANEPTGPQVNIVGKIALEFTGEAETLEKLHNLSAVQRDGDWLWVASDELTTLERLTRSTDADGEVVYTGQRSFPLGDLGVSLPAGNEKEIDVEGMDLANDYLWLVGSHSSTRMKLEPDDDVERALEEFAEVRERPNRHLLFRIALERDTHDVSPVAETTPSGASDASDASEEPITTAALIGDLTEALKSDDHLGPFLEIPAKENGLDVEGLAVFGDRVMIGLRGPVLRGWATILEVEPQQLPNDSTRLTLGSPPYRKHFLGLGDLGVRDLCRDGDDLLVLAGPSMGLDGPVRVYRWRDAVNGRDQEIVAGSDLSVAVELPFGNGDDHAEGISVFSPDGKPSQLLVVYDSPSAGRLKEGEGALNIFADLTAPLP